MSFEMNFLPPYLAEKNMVAIPRSVPKKAIAAAAAGPNTALPPGEAWGRT